MKKLKCYHCKNKITTELWKDKYEDRRSWWHEYFNSYPIIRFCDECGKNIEYLQLCPDNSEGILSLKKTS